MRANHIGMLIKAWTSSLFNLMIALLERAVARTQKSQRLVLGCASLCCLLLSGAAFATANPLNAGAGHAAMAIEGDWLVNSRDAVIRIERAGDAYVGHIIWQLHDTYGPEDGPALNGKTVTDRNNPEPARRAQPLTGLQLLWGLRYDAGNQKWIDGHIYNANDGRTYSCEVRLLAPDRLKLRGYIGFTLLGGSTTWSRVTMTTPMRGELPFVSRAANG